MPCLTLAQAAGLGGGRFRTPSASLFELSLSSRSTTRVTTTCMGKRQVACDTAHHRYVGKGIKYNMNIPNTFGDNLTNKLKCGSPFFMCHPIFSEIVTTQRRGHLLRHILRSEQLLKICNKIMLSQERQSLVLGSKLLECVQFSWESLQLFSATYGCQCMSFTYLPPVLPSLPQLPTVHHRQHLECNAQMCDVCNLHFSTGSDLWWHCNNRYPDYRITLILARWDEDISNRKSCSLSRKNRPWRKYSLGSWPPVSCDQRIALVRTRWKRPSGKSTLNCRHTFSTKQLKVECHRTYPPGSVIHVDIWYDHMHQISGSAPDCFLHCNKTAVCLKYIFWSSSGTFMSDCTRKSTNSKCN